MLNGERRDQVYIIEIVLGLVMVRFMIILVRRLVEVVLGMIG